MMKSSKFKVQNSKFKVQSSKVGGFTLIELMVGLAIAAFVAMAGYVTFLSSNRSYNVQEDVSEAQQNVRVAMDRVVKDLRTAGFGLPNTPFSLGFDTDGDGTDDLYLTAPVTFTNSSTGPDTITIFGIGYEVGRLQKGGSTDCNDAGKSKICLDSVASTNNFFTGSGPYTFQPNRRYITLNGITFIELASTQTEADRSSGKLALGNPATLDRDYQDGTPVYIIQAVTYSIATDLTGCSAAYPCLAAQDLTMLRGSGRQVVAMGIEDIQFAYGIDSNPRDGKIDYSGSYASNAFQDNPSDPFSIIAVRANLVAKTRDEDPTGAKTFQKVCLEDRKNDTNCTGAAPDGYRRRALTKIIKIRNPKTGW